ncbi:MAG TPA: malectin domain-containing carbohydrate-binding protein [Puia sp.]|nr:malectin domain-containing carbohydrate-binding protein [Puia sp.]
MRTLSFILLFCTLTAAIGSAVAQSTSGSPRRDILIDENWQTSLDSIHWLTVDVPHNWDDYYGYRRLRHGNLHGTALYRKTITVDKSRGLRYFLWFEGVGSYATVWVNHQESGTHAGGRTSFTLDITSAVHTGENNILVRADHPAFIRDLPWVCGGCSEERGFSEGSQPLGIFRPVHLVITNETRIEPFGVHIWNDTTVTQHSATLFLETELKNYGPTSMQGTVTQQLFDAKGKVVATVSKTQDIAPGQTTTVSQQITAIRDPHLWSTKTPYLYQLVTIVTTSSRLIDRVTTPYGIRTIRWPDPHQPGAHPFLLNGSPVFINGIAGYEHRIGNSHAFTSEEIKARVQQIRAAGFNAFRDAHQPHNLRFQHYWDSLGILWWPQLSAHIWFDSPAFRKNFKTALTEWVKERRNSPSLILWGLQNESKLPEDFARECTALIRQLDPTASSQRLVTTCNGGSGTDWDVPQNWTGTYGGDPATYGADLERQILVGEYGGWRTIDLHGDTLYSEDRLDALMEKKIYLADSVRNEVAGHFAWLFASHDNPGRVQSGEGLREIDRIGPVNYKGLLTSWEEPLDLYYLYRSNFVSAATSPMVYIVSHTWPDRWSAPGPKSGIEVYSNCDQVELFNDIDGVSLGKRTRKGTGTHFQWDNVDIRYNVLYAVGYYHGKPAARDTIVLANLPESPHFRSLKVPTGLLDPAPGYHYLYRVNCGGPDYTDHEGHLWLADRHYTGGRYWGSRSWTDDFPGLPAFFASQRYTADPIAGTTDWPLFQDFRYGLQKLAYTFPVQDGDYRLELYFAEPWLGRGGGMDCTGWRSFDVAVNGKTVLKDLDIWKEAGHARALKKVVNVHITGGRLQLGFPHIAAGQAVISALAIATLDGHQTAAPPSNGILGEKGAYFLDTAYVTPQADTTLRVDSAADVYTGRDHRRYPAGATIAVKAGNMARITPATNLEPAYDSKPATNYKNARIAGDTTEWSIDIGVGDTYSLTVKYRWLSAATTASLEIRQADGLLIKKEPATLATTLPAKWNYITTTTGTMINAGRYIVRLIVHAEKEFRVSELQVQ